MELTPGWGLAAILSAIYDITEGQFTELPALTLKSNVWTLLISREFIKRLQIENVG